MSRTARAAKRSLAPRLEPAALAQLSVPIPMPLAPMEATRAKVLPKGDDWQFEPKWDGFRAIVFRTGDDVVLQSKAGQPLSRYFPELLDAFRALPGPAFVLDGEIIVLHDGQISFDDLLLRIHPAASRIAKLAHDIPSTFMAFDLLYEKAGGSLRDKPLYERRSRLESLFSAFPPSPRIRLSPVTEDRGLASRWFAELGPLGLDGVMAKTRSAPYRSGTRDAMIKVKHLRTADCVVGGFRYAAGQGSSGKRKTLVGSLLLGLYDRAGLLHFVGFTSSFAREQRIQITEAVEPLKGGTGFSGKAPGGPSRWTTGEHREWEKLDPVLVCEVEYDYFTQGRFRHGTKFLRWRPDKSPRQCHFDQVERTVPGEGVNTDLFGQAESRPTRKRD